jgi:hypothetical protein
MRFGCGASGSHPVAARIEFRRHWLVRPRGSPRVRVIRCYESGPDGLCGPWRAGCGWSVLGTGPAACTSTEGSPPASGRRRVRPLDHRRWRTRGSLTVTETPCSPCASRRRRPLLRDSTLRSRERRSARPPDLVLSQPASHSPPGIRTRNPAAAPAAASPPGRPWPRRACKSSRRGPSSWVTTTPTP